MSKTLVVGQSQQNDLAKVMADAISHSLKPMLRRLESIELQVRANSNAVESIERESLVQKIVKANLLSMESAKALQINALRELAKTVDTRSSAEPSADVWSSNSAAQVDSGSFLENVKAAGGDK